MKITVFGSGYVGLVTGACLADVGHSVTCVDVDSAKIENLKNGIIPIYEPGLEPMVKRNYAEKRLHFTTDAKVGVEFGEIVFIAVGTPPNEDGSADLKYVLNVAKTIGAYMNGYKVVVDKSTVPVGTAEKVKAAIALELKQRGVSFEFDVCSNPEFLKEGAAIEDFTKAARIVVGTDSDKVQVKMRECYGPYNRNHDKMMFMDIRAAELTKYAANAMLATKISFMNEMANLAESLGVDIEQVRLGIGSDPRIGYHFIYPGCGYGGSCFPKDVQALVRTASEYSQPMPVLNAVEAVNKRQKNVLFEKVKRALGSDLMGKTIAVWGLAFKPNTDDMREAPSRNLIESLWAAGAKVQAYDPEAMPETAKIYGKREDLHLVTSREEAVTGADALVICTEWKQFRSIDAEWLKSELKQPILIDGRNIFNPKEMKQAGIKYYAIGRGESLVGSEA
nr:UDP-glucose/GDP-mannose dehydrogenase family protein [Bdellovibrio sp. HM001]